jgi:hypothetical protein
MNIAEALSECIVPIPVKSVRFDCSWLRLQSDTKCSALNIPILRGLYGMSLNNLNKQLYDKVFYCDHPQYIIRPHIKSRIGSETEYRITNNFSFEFIIFNEAVQHWDVLLNAWKLAGLIGYDKKRIRFNINKITDIKYDLQVNRLNKLMFPHGLRLMKKGKLVIQPDFYDIILACLYRLQTVNKDFNIHTFPHTNEILELAKPVPSIWQGETVAIKRYSARQRQEFAMQEIFGMLHLAQHFNADSFQPLLQFASLFHIGKGSIIGLGKVLTI